MSSGSPPLAGLSVSWVVRAMTEDGVTVSRLESESTTTRTMLRFPPFIHFRGCNKGVTDVLRQRERCRRPKRGPPTSRVPSRSRETPSRGGSDNRGDSRRTSGCMTRLVSVPPGNSWGSLRKRPELGSFPTRRGFVERQKLKHRRL